MKVYGDSQEPIQLHPGANVYDIDFRAGGGPLNSGEKVGSVRSLSVLRSLVGGKGGSTVLPFAKTESKVENFSPEYHTVLFVLAEHILSYFNALGHESQRRFASMGYHDTKHRALGVGDVLDSQNGTVGCRDI